MVSKWYQCLDDKSMYNVCSLTVIFNIDLSCKDYVIVEETFNNKNKSKNQSVYPKSKKLFLSYLNIFQQNLVPIFPCRRLPKICWKIFL